MAEWELFRKDTIGNSGISTAVRDRVSKTLYLCREGTRPTLNQDNVLVGGQFEQDTVLVQGHCEQDNALVP
jgi:hypothetical protein